MRKEPTLHTQQTDGLLRILDWMVSQGQERLSTTRTVVSVRNLALARALFPS